MRHKNSKKFSCQLCNYKALEVFYHQPPVPVINNVFYNSREEALKAPKGKIDLTFCANCGFIYNSSFDPKLASYTQQYETARSCSRTYVSYVDNVIDLLINRFDIKNKKILEIGCWDGEFLKRLCSKSNSSGVGIDPAYKGPKNFGDIRFISDYFENVREKISADVLVLRHTLEHLGEPDKFLNYVVSKINAENLTVIVEVPDFGWIARRGEFWDITYEHCNYFIRESLANLLGLCKIDTLKVFNVFNGQYLLSIGTFRRKDTLKFELRPGNHTLVEQFSKKVDSKYKNLEDIFESKELFTMWGVAGKGVVFLNLLKRAISTKIPFCLDDNPKKSGKFTPGTGHKIFPHQVLAENYVKNVLVMNPIYYQEMRYKLKRLGVNSRLIQV